MQFARVCLGELIFRKIDGITRPICLGKWVKATTVKAAPAAQPSSNI